VPTHAVTDDCSLRGQKYVPVHSAKIGKTDAAAYLAFLRATGVAFAPKTDSNCLRLGQGQGRADADNDGVAIFWLRSEFSPIHLDFLAFNDPKRNQGVRRWRVSHHPLPWRAAPTSPPIA
jgi:hypothetical protein